MKLKILGSGSTGNCYILENENEALVIECGVKFSDVKKALKFNLRKVTAALVSHSHNDHAGYIKDFVKSGITVLAPVEVFEAKGINSQASFIRSLEPNKAYKVGNFKIIPFELSHDVRCFGYLISHEETGTILFATDTYKIPYEFAGINNILIEANYCEDIVYQNIFNNRLNAIHQDRVEHSHMSIQNTLKLLENTDLSAVNNIILIHLSDGNSNAKNFKSKVESQTAKSVYIAEKGLELSFDRTPF